jgi:hypothetical protein
MFIVNQLSGKSIANLFSTHPPIQEKIMRWRSMRKSWRDLILESTQRPGNDHLSCWKGAGNQNGEAGLSEW